jgi:hypothetical protein
MTSTMFRAHGSFRIAAHGDLLVVDGWGPWNANTATEYAQAIENACELMPAAWALLVRFRQDPVMWQETENKIRAAIVYRVAHGMKATAVVMPALPESGIVRTQYGRLYSECGADYAFFAADAEAIAWLAERGFGAEAGNLFSK